MPDVLDPLRRLGHTGVGDAEPVAELRARAARRRRRQRAMAVPVLALLIGGTALAVATLRDDREPDRGVETVDDPDPTTTAAPTTAPTTVTSVVPTGVDLGPSRQVIGGPDGITVVDPETGASEVVTTDPISIAFGYGNDAIVAQRAATDDGPGAIAVFEDGEARELVVASDPGNTTHLHDVADLATGPAAVVSWIGGESPETWEVRLELLDLTTGERTSLGVVGGWEEGVSWVNVLPDDDLLFRKDYFEGFDLERRTIDGETVWKVTGVDASVRVEDVYGSSGVVVHQDQVLVLDSIDPDPPTGSDPKEVVIRRFDVSTGASRPTSTVFVGGAERTDTYGVCGGSVESTSAGLVCARGEDGGSLVLDPSDGDTLLLSGPAAAPGATVTLWRSAAGA